MNGRADGTFTNCPFSLTLFTDTQFGDDGTVSFDIGFRQVVEQVPPFTDHFKQAAPGMVVFLIDLEMLGQIVDAPCEEGNLNFRGTGVALSAGILFDDRVFFFL